jgi:hypothetical protein
MMNQMSRYPIFALLALVLASPARADFTFIVPQQPAGGTAQWALIVKVELEKTLGEKINLKYLPGARDIAGFNKFHLQERFDDRTVMVSHGGNGVSFIQEKVEYDYADYDCIGLQSLNIIMALRSGVDPFEKTTRLRFASGSGEEPEALAMALLVGGPRLSTPEHIENFKKRVNWVLGMSSAERRLAFRRGELTGTRETPVAFKTHVETMIAEGSARLWMHHGLLNTATGRHGDDPNYPAGYQFEQLYKKQWGVEPSGELYDAYRLIKSWRDGVQKALWVNKGNPNTQRLREALKRMLENPASVASVERDVGRYEWIVGEQCNRHVDILRGFIGDEALKTLVRFNKEALGVSSVYKPQLAQAARPGNQVARQSAP